MAERLTGDEDRYIVLFRDSSEPRKHLIQFLLLTCRREDMIIS